MWWRSLVILALFALVGSGCKKEAGTGGDGSSSETERPTIAVISQGGVPRQWELVHAGARKAAGELDAEIVWKGPDEARDVEQQSSLVRSFIAQGVDGIILAPLDDEAIEKAVEAATQAKIPVVLIHSPLTGRAQKSIVVTDHLAAGKLAGKRMVEKLGGEGKVLLLREQRPKVSASNRERGFLDVAKAASGIEVVVGSHGGTSESEILASSERLLLAHEAGRAGGVRGVYATTESATTGMLLAAEKLKLSDQIALVGFGASKPLLAALDAGRIDALVLEDAHRMGYIAVATLVTHVMGESVDPTYNLAPVLATKDNLGEPEVKRLIASPE